MGNLYNSHNRLFFKSSTIYMESASQSDNPPQQSSSRLAGIIGTFVALLTLTIPFVMITYFSSSGVDSLPRSTLLKLRE